jgi:hypothetical protein
LLLTAKKESLPRRHQVNEHRFVLLRVLGLGGEILSLPSLIVGCPMHIVFNPRPLASFQISSALMYIPSFNLNGFLSAVRAEEASD